MRVPTAQMTCCTRTTKKALPIPDINSNNSTKKHFLRYPVKPISWIKAIKSDNGFGTIMRELESFVIIWARKGRWIPFLPQSRWWLCFFLFFWLGELEKKRRKKLLSLWRPEENSFLSKVIVRSKKSYHHLVFLFLSPIENCASHKSEVIKRKNLFKYY